jgi:hypothetical protein
MLDSEPVAGKIQMSLVTKDKAHARSPQSEFSSDLKRLSRQTKRASGHFHFVRNLPPRQISDTLLHYFFISVKPANFSTWSAKKIAEYVKKLAETVVKIT